MPPDPATTVRGRCTAEIRRRLEALPFVGLVLPPGARSEADDKAIARCITEGMDGLGAKAAVEMAVGSDEAAETEASYAEMASFWVSAYIHLPVPAVLDSGDNPRTADDLAADYAGQVYVLYATDDGGRWEDDQGVTARHTRRLGGGGVGVDPDLGTNVTEEAFEVTYAYRRGAPEVAA
jgi:hypothetical protein